ncbi:acyltransferase family protein [Microvirga sesbaniae]|uniref:acyltransferase family protein n=1 Tax=Microvirga sesbaniae TaxID=681392 RepID=UPI00358DD6D0
MFFLVSGFIITHSINDESRGTFVLKRVFRIYPAWIVAAVLIQLQVICMGWKTPLTFEQYFRGITLFGIYDENPTFLIGAEWTLLIEIKFYFITIVFIPYIRKFPVAAYLVQALIVAGMIVICRKFGTEVFLLAVQVSYIPILLFGQLIYFLYMQMISRATFIGLCSLNFLLTIYVIRDLQPGFLEPVNSYIITIAYCFAIFMAVIHLCRDLKMGRIGRFFENISYSLYLYHANIGIVTVGLLFPLLPYWLTFFVAFAVMLAVSWISYRYVELWGMQRVRSILKPRSRTQIVAAGNAS